MRILIVIPARYASTRFRGKALAGLRGATGIVKPLIQRSWEAATRTLAEGDSVVVATDDARIAQAVKNFGGRYVMTPKTCANGTERCSAVLDILPGADRFDTIVNLQGDSPLTPPSLVRKTSQALQRDPSCSVATPVTRCDARASMQFRKTRKEGRAGGTTAVSDKNGYALYFSKEVLPFGGGESSNAPILHHIGLYAYRPTAIREYVKWPVGVLEASEGLEQLRFLENGSSILCVEVATESDGFWEVNLPSDIPLVEEGLYQQGIE